MLRSTMNKLPARIAQLTVINGRKIPSALYRLGTYRSRNISKIWTRAAITPINEINVKYSTPHGTRI